MRLIDADSLRSGLNSDSVIGTVMLSAIDEYKEKLKELRLD